MLLSIFDGGLLDDILNQQHHNASIKLFSHLPHAAGKGGDSTHREIYVPYRVGQNHFSNPLLPHPRTQGLNTEL